MAAQKRLASERRGKRGAKQVKKQAHRRNETPNAKKKRAKFERDSAAGASSPGSTTRVKAAAKRRGVRGKSAQAEQVTEVVIDAVVPPEPAESFESGAHAMRSWVLLDEGFSTSRGDERLDAIALSRLRAHVLVMRHGRFAGPQGLARGYSSLTEDAESLVREHLRAWIASLARSTHGHESARIVLCAHDAFASEDDLLRRARHHAGWWLANGVYPIHIVWESGLEETVTQLVSNARARCLGGELPIEQGVDPLIEGAVRVLGGPTMWAGAKRGAERAFDADGAGRRLLTLLKEEIERSPRPVELHLVGIGAGASFQSQWVRTMAAMNARPARTLTLLAPTTSVAEFRTSVAPFVGFAVRRLSLFTLARDLERSDRCGVYRKSFLSLLRGALEEEAQCEILGLEESLRRSPDVARLFGLGGAMGAPGEALFAGVSPGVTDAVTLSDFDDDPATMNSVLRRVLDQPLGGIIAYRSLGRSLGQLEGQSVEKRLAEEFDARGIDFAWMRSTLLRQAQNAPAMPEQASAADSAPLATATAEDPGVSNDGSLDQAESPAPEGAEASSEEPTRSATLIEVIPANVEAPAVAEVHALRIAPLSPQRHASGRKFALSVGIDRYPGRPLNGATADALLWNETFAKLGFVTREPLLDGMASRAEILSNLRSLLSEARRGDTVAMHFAGYGASVHDAWAEEGNEGSTTRFEALVPVDADAGAFILGGDLAELLREASEGVHVAFFFDCSFGGSVSRIFASHLMVESLPTRDDEVERDTDIEPLPRTFVVSDALGARHVAFRRRMGQLLRPGAGWDGQHEGAHALYFVAARADERAWERDGYGDFSLAATRVLRTAHHRGTLAQLTNRSFLTAVESALREYVATGPTNDHAGQTPELHARDVVRDAPLFQSAVEEAFLGQV